ncbi:transporter, putative [Babesia microti strain RI]|uniref:Transporter, putative n=1 Tax=Babesia microti (strain RI) TaxID=1133968 RepID=A0A1N6LWN3_BABMR|nr:transporter, putative [Babesia microti strain RI]SIO73284.1 transporter, putative [Babesia microti strain RI]|eukprot:XP_021337388.1 transporter, putative [Babesia microti strain RI]
MLKKLKALIPDRKYNRHFLLICYCFIILNCGAIFYGWKGFIGLLYKAGSFEDSCSDSNGKTVIKINDNAYLDCNERQFQISVLSSLAVTAHIMCSPISGLIMDFFGNKICYIVGQLFYILTWILFACFPKNEYVIKASFFIMGFFSEAQAMPLISIGKLYPENEFLVISIIGTVRSLSFVIPIILDRIFSLSYFESSDLYIICIIYIFVSVVPSLIIGIITVPWSIKTVQEIEDAENITEETPKLTFKEKYHKMLQFLYMVIKHPALIECILACGCVFTQMARVDILNKAQMKLFTTTDGSSASDAVAYLTILAFIPCPMFGFISDKYGPPTAFLILQFFSSISIIFLVFDNIITKYISALGYFFSASFFISSVYSFINWRFDKELFGRISGVVFVVVGSLLMTNIIWMKMATSDVFNLGARSYDAISYICISHCIIGMACAIVLYYITKKSKPLEITES